MQVAGRPDIPIVIRNISASGMGATTTGLMPIKGEEVIVLLPSGTTAAGSIRWVKGKAFGLAFFEHICVDDQIADRSAQPPASTWEVKVLHQFETPRVDPSKLRRL